MKLNDEDILYFLRNGQLKSVEYRTEKKSVVNMFGNPDFESEIKFGFQRIDYERIQLYFQSESLVNIQIYPRINCDLTIDEAFHLLNKHKIEFTEIPSEVDFYRNFKTSSGVELSFTNQDDGKTWLLHCFGKSIEIAQ
jgi:hypothetical protein